MSEVLKGESSHSTPYSAGANAGSIMPANNQRMMRFYTLSENEMTNLSRANTQFAIFLSLATCGLGGVISFGCSWISADKNLNNLYFTLLLLSGFFSAGMGWLSANAYRSSKSIVDVIKNESGERSHS